MPEKTGRWYAGALLTTRSSAIDTSIRVQFVHGLEGSPQGNKARLLDSAFSASTPAMDTADFEGCVRLQAAEIERFAPHVVIGSSFGGAVVLALLQRGQWSGPTLLLAQAGLRYGLPPQLPDGVPVWIVHGQRDEVVDPADSRRLAASGDPRSVRLLELDDDHSLHAATASGALLDWVRALAAVDGR